MFRRHSRRSTNIVFVIFRLFLSLTMFALLLGGLYSAYKHFSGVDSVKLDLTSAVSSLEKMVPPQIAQYLPFKKDQSSSSLNDVLSQITSSSSQPASEIAFDFVLISDSHSDNVNFQKALGLIKNFSSVQFLIGLGDYTEVGTIDELKNAKEALDQSGIRYFLAPGDHDLWDSRDKSKPALANFREVFGPSYQSFDYQNFKFILVFNSDNYAGVDSMQLSWLKSQLEDGKNRGLNILVFVHEPLFHPSSDHFMGRVEPKLKDQARELIRLFSENGVKKVFAGDAHLFSEYTEPETNLSMITVGAVTSERNLQLPSFARVWVYEDGTIRVEDVEIK